LTLGRRQKGFSVAGADGFVNTYSKTIRDYRKFHIDCQIFIYADGAAKTPENPQYYEKS
jgi:hypothetical protein